jgi:hypothetical protein
VRALFVAVGAVGAVIGAVAVVAAVADFVDAWRSRPPVVRGVDGIWRAARGR